MKLKKITTSQMELLIYEYFEKSSLVVVPRFSSMNGCQYEDKTTIWGTRYERIVNHECDILSVSKNMFLREVEIKVSVSDFKADFQKKHQHIDENIRQFYYAVPSYILDKIKDLVPENAGILVAELVEKVNRNEKTISNWKIKKYKSPKSNNLAKPIDDKKLNAIFRIGYLKYWFHRKRTENNCNCYHENI